MNMNSFLGVIGGLTLIATIAAIPQYSHQVAVDQSGGKRMAAAPTVVSGDNIYVAWWTNKTANGDGEVMFRASNDNGATFGDKINLSNNTVTNSVDAEIAAEGGNVMVTWWERNSTSNEPVAKISTDNGQTFGPVLRLATNGTIGNNEE